MRTRNLAALLTIAAIVSFAPSASAQYMYLDANGNGVHDAGDRLNANGTATTVDLYLWTNQNRDGSTAVCDVGSEFGDLSINAYAINLLAVNGTVTYSGFVNQQATMPNAVSEVNPDGVQYENGHFGIRTLPPGLVRLCTLTITGMSGFPRIDIVDIVSQSQDFTMFAPVCPGIGGDNTYRLDGPNTRAFYGGPGDWFDTDGLVGPTDFGPPVLAAIGNKTVDELAALTFTATATDPNPGATLTFTLDAGAPAGASIGASTGAFSWTPTEAQGPGIFHITVRVTNNASPPLSDIETITATVNEVNSAPILSQIGSKATTVGSPLAFTATATDADLPPNTLCFSLDGGAPPGTTINCSGAFMWTPTPGQVGTFVITVRVTDNGLPPLSDSETIGVIVGPGVTTPTADAGGPYTGIVNGPVNFDGTGSSDPTGDVLTYAWDFSDGSTGTGVTPTHTYSAPGVYNVVLRVTDPDGNFDEDITTVTIRPDVSVMLVFKNGKSTLSLGDKGVLKVGIEGLEQQYASVLVGTLRLSTDFPNAGTVAECAADPNQIRIGDLDRNGVPDLELRFPMACIRDLFRNTPNNSTVNLILTGQFQTSTGMVPLRGVKVVTIKRGGGGSAPVLAYPNPFNPQGKLSFMTTRPGSASIQMFDLQGRLVRTVLPQQYLGAGDHEVTVDGLSDQGTRLSSGVYFYRVCTADGIMEGSVNVLK